jgi:ABC-type antimicrobial peptide transport system permease subunit
MRFSDYVLIAFRNIRRQKLRSALTIFAVVIGATSITIMLAAVFSLKGFMTKQFEANGTFQQVLVSPQTDITWGNNGGNQCQDCVKLTDDMAAKTTFPRQAYSEAHQGQGDNGGQDFRAAPTTLTGKIVGVVSSADRGYVIRVPLEWARGMLENQQVQMTPADQAAAQARCRNAHGPCNTQPIPTGIAVSDELAKQGYNSYIVKVDQSSNAAAVAKALSTKYKVGAADAQTEINKQLAIFNILGLVLGGIGGIALVVAAVGVVNTMIMSILERTREIGVMRAVGARRGTVSLLFTIEAALLGFWGGVFGLAIGYGAVLVANPIINRQLSGNNISSSNIITLPIWLIIGVIALTTVIGILAGLYPARRAAHLDPVEALHYE